MQYIIYAQLTCKYRSYNLKNSINEFMFFKIRCNIKSGTFQKINQEFDTSTVKYKIFYDEKEKLITRPNIKKALLPTKKYTFRNKKKSYNLSSELSTNTSSDIKIIRLVSIECFECNSLWAPCNNPIELNSLKQNRVRCAGSCYQYMNSNGGKL